MCNTNIPSDIGLLASSQAKFEGVLHDSIDIPWLPNVPHFPSAGWPGDHATSPTDELPSHLNSFASFFVSDVIIGLSNPARNMRMRINKGALKC